MTELIANPTKKELKSWNLSIETFRKYNMRNFPIINDIKKQLPNIRKEAKRLSEKLKEIKKKDLPYTNEVYEMEEYVKLASKLEDNLKRLLSY